MEKDLVNRCTLPLLMLLWCVPAAAETFRVFTEAEQSDDSDHQSQSKVALGYQATLPKLGSDAFWATRIGHRRLTSPTGGESFEYLGFEGQRPLTGNAGLRGSLDLNRGSNWSPVLGSLSANWLPAKAWRFEATAERDMVDTVLAVRDQTRFDTGSLSVDWNLTSTVTAVAAGGYSSFSDGNDRLKRSARLIWSPAQWQWFNVQLRAQRADSDAVGLGYFNPRRLEQYEAKLRFAGAPFGDQWLLSLLAGVGEQRIDSENPTGTYSLEARARGWINPHYGIESRAICTNAGNLSTADAQSGYRFCELGIELIARW